jgi:hypothetical protein
VKAVIAAVIIAASPGVVFAESWVLWESHGNTMIKMSRPKSVSVHETKAACLVAARDHAGSMYTSQLQSEQRSYKVVEGQSTSNPKPDELPNGQGSTTSLIVYQHSSIDVEYGRRYIHIIEFVAECWPVGSTPQ